MTEEARWRRYNEVARATSMREILGGSHLDWYRGAIVSTKMKEWLEREYGYRFVEVAVPAVHHAERGARTGWKIRE